MPEPESTRKPSTLASLLPFKLIIIFNLHNLVAFSENDTWLSLLRSYFCQADSYTSVIPDLRELTPKIPLRIGVKNLYVHWSFAPTYCWQVLFLSDLLLHLMPSEHFLFLYIKNLQNYCQV